MSTSYIRMATKDDWREILDIYEPYIHHTAITFDYVSFSKEEFQGKIKKIISKFPYLVYVVEEEIVAYAYCTPYLEKEGFSWDCEITIYMKEEYRGRGIASILYETLLKMIKLQGYCNIYALICVPNVESVALHKKFGFTEMGIYKKTAYKLGKWQDLLVMEKQMNEYNDQPAKPIGIQDINVYEILDGINKKLMDLLVN